MCIRDRRSASKRVRRRKLAPRSSPFNACVARPVGRPRSRGLLPPKRQREKERGRLRDKYVWGKANPREWGD
eukprot:10508501-Alexandrium_andersonii.AAC.1